MKTKEFCIIGIEGFTLKIANSLKDAGFKVVIIDTQEDKIEALSSKFEYVYKADATNISALEEININEFDQVIVGVSSMEQSILIVSNLRQLKVKNIIAKVRNEIQKRILNVLTDYNINIIWPEEIVSDMTSFRIIHDIDVNISMFNDDVSIIKVPVQNPKFFELEIKDFELKSQYLTNIILIERGSEIIFPVRSTTKLLSDDIITIACKSGTIDKIVSLFTKK